MTRLKNIALLELEPPHSSIQGWTHTTEGKLSRFTPGSNTNTIFLSNTQSTEIPPEYNNIKPNTFFGDPITQLKRLYGLENGIDNENSALLLQFAKALTPVASHLNQAVPFVNSTLGGSLQAILPTKNLVESTILDVHNDVSANSYGIESGAEITFSKPRAFLSRSLNLHLLEIPTSNKFEVSNNTDRTGYTLIQIQTPHKQLKKHFKKNETYWVSNLTLWFFLRHFKIRVLRTMVFCETISLKDIVDIDSFRSGDKLIQDFLLYSLVTALTSAKSKRYGLTYPYTQSQSLVQNNGLITLDKILNTDDLSEYITPTYISRRDGIEVGFTEYGNSNYEEICSYLNLNQYLIAKYTP